MIRNSYKSDLKWLRNQESRWHELETKKFKKLPQLSSKILERFLKEKDLDSRTKRLIKQHLLNRKKTKEIAKDMSQYRRSWTAAEKAGENQLILNEKK
jgi:hypothetical protein